MKLYRKICVQCGREFIAKRPHALCCGQECRRQHSIQVSVEEAERGSGRVPRRKSRNGRGDHVYLTLPEAETLLFGGYIQPRTTKKLRDAIARIHRRP